jgi:hypothetical protein
VLDVGELGPCRARGEMPWSSIRPCATIGGAVVQTARARGPQRARAAARPTISAMVAEIELVRSELGPRRGRQSARWSPRSRSTGARRRTRPRRRRRRGHADRAELEVCGAADIGEAVAEVEVDQEHAGEHDRGGDSWRGGARSSSLAVAARSFTARAVERRGVHRRAALASRNACMQRRGRVQALPLPELTVTARLCITAR